ncbi:MAG: hypothetical protein ACI9G1_001826 [Pirellulaceae bacterium]|jgi:hypothetical protein
MARWIAAATTIGITPTSPVMLAGFASRAEPHTEVFSPLEANLLLLDDGATRVLLVSLDLLFVGSELLEFIRDTCEPHLPRENVFVCATHTHGAPATDCRKPLLGGVDEGYMKLIKERLNAALSDVFSQRGEVVIARLKQGAARHSINRRRTTCYWSQEGIRRVQEMAPNPAGFRDERIRILELSSSNGKVQALIWHYACHPVSFPDLKLVTADFPGVARSALRRSAGAVPVLYFQGFSGDIRPALIDRGDGKSWGRRVRDFLDGEKIVFGKSFARASLLQWEAWVDSLARAVTAVQTKLGTRINSAIRIGNYDFPIDRIREGHSEYRMQFQQIAFGHQLKLLGVSAEVVSSYIRCLPSNTIGVGCVGDVFGYYPTDSMLSEGGYEVDEFAHYFDLPGSFRSGLNGEFRNAIREMEQA